MKNDKLQQCSVLFIKWRLIIFNIYTYDLIHGQINKKSSRSEVNKQNNVYLNIPRIAKATRLFCPPDRLSIGLKASSPETPNEPSCLRYSSSGFPTYENKNCCHTPKKKSSHFDDYHIHNNRKHDKHLYFLCALNTMVSILNINGRYPNK